ncbi:MAG: PadR family transcriptional regulator [Acidobacteria bacterium]|nr:PadR family transcriptional regulator [Acidobacteriota bacterium]
MRKRTGLSELEGATLGVVWTEEPCTPYTIRRLFQSSPSPFWSGSAGAIYPLVERLEKRGFLRAQATRTGKRKGWLYSLTPAGLRAARGWMGPPLPRWAVGVPMDALRTRVRFLGALTPSRRKAFIDEAIDMIGEEIRLVDADRRARLTDPDPFNHLMGQGAVLMLRARQAWLRGVRSVMERAGPRPARRHFRS